MEFPEKTLGNTTENTLLSLSSQSVLGMLDTEDWTFTFGFAVCNCTQDLPESSPPFLLDDKLLTTLDHTASSHF